MKYKITRRNLLQGTTAFTLGAGFTVMGPWKHNRVWAQKTDKPILIGLTHDASGQFAQFAARTRCAARSWRSTSSTPRAACSAARSTTSPPTPRRRRRPGTRVAERMITRNEVAFLVGAIQSGVANAIGQVAQKYGVVYFNTNSSSPTEAGKDCQRVKFVWDGTGAELRQRRGVERHQGLRQELAAAHQRLCLGPQHVEGDARDRRQVRRRGRRRDPGAGRHARLLADPAEDPAGEARRRGGRGRRRRLQGACASRSST